MPQVTARTYTLKTLAEKLGADVLGDETAVAARVVHPSDSTHESDLVVAFDKNLHPLLNGIPAHYIVLAQGQEELGKKFKATLIVKRPRYAMALLTQMFAPLPVVTGIHASAVIDATAKIGSGVSIGPLCVVGAHAEIGDNTRLAPHVTIGEHVKVGADCLFYSGVRIADHVTIGSRVIINYNSVIGSDGFSFVTPEPGAVETTKESGSGTVQAFNTQLARIYSLGSVILNDDVEIGACTSIDRGTLTHTRIGKGSKIDNQVQIGHNVVMGENCLVCGSAGIAGSVTIGNRVTLGARSGIADHVRTGDDAILMACAQLAGNLPSKAVYMGAPALPREKNMEQIMHLARMKNTVKRLSELEEKVNALSKRNEGQAS